MKRMTIVVMGLLLAGCGHARVSSLGPAPIARTPPPSGVVVTDFLIDAGGVRLDSSPGARVLRTADGTPAPEAEAKAALAAREALMQALVGKLGAEGLAATRAADDTALHPGVLLVRGDLADVDAGNRLRRMVIGFGAGKSQVVAHAQLFLVGADGSRHFIEAMTATADSGHMPGGATTLGAGAAAQAVSGATHVAGEARQGTDAEAASIGTALGRQIGTYAATQGWIAPASVQ